MDTVSPHALGLTGGNFTLFSGSADVGAPGRVRPMKRLYQLAQRWRWILVGGVVCGVMLGLLVTMMMTPQYASTVRLEINREADRVVNIDSVERDTSIGDQEFYQTEYGLLQTKALAERVVRDLDLVDDPSFQPMAGRSGLQPVDRSKRVGVAAKILLNHVGVAPVRGSRLVDVTAVTPDAALSARIARAWSDNFIQSTLERRFDSSNYARRFLEQRLAQLREKLEQSERAAVGYAASQGIITLPSASNAANGGSANGTPDRSLVTDDLSASNNALSTATAERIATQSRLLQANRPDASTEALSNDAITAMRQKRADAAAEYAKQMIQFEPDYPPALANAAQIRALDMAIAREEGRIRTSLNQTYRSALERENVLKAQVGGLKQDLNQVRRRTIQYNIYQRDADTNRELYNALLQRYKEIGVAGGVEKNNVSVVDPPQVPERPVTPNLIVNLILSTLAGAVGGLGLAGVLAQIDEGLSDPAEVEEKLGLPLLGTVPRLKGEDPIEALKNPRSGIVEAYLSVQANLELSTAQGTPRSLAVTSSRPREGKSTTTIALAQSLVRARRKVVLVDADMRSPSVHSHFGIENSLGVSNFLAGKDDLTPLLHAIGDDGLTIMTAGPQPPNAGDLLTGDRIRMLIERLQQQFDHVIVDCPPVLGLADAPLAAAAVEAVVYVVEAGSIQAGMVRMALSRLRAAQVNLLGVMLTKLDSKRSHIGYGYDYGYGYGR
jgi:succinoglycan biosynthesis transport protein ExoP